MAKDPVLDLNTLIDRPTIRIDGKSYELYSADELSIMQAHWFTVKGQAIEASAGEEDQDGIEALVDEVSRACLVSIPVDVFERLSSSHKLAITELFTQLLRRRKMRVAGAIAQTVLESQAKHLTPNQPTGAKSSPAFNGSSEAIRSGGSNAPRQPS